MAPDTPSLPQPAPDPALAQEQQQAQDSLIKGLHAETQGDTASLMARYGTQLAMAGSTGGSPLATPSMSYVPGRAV